MEKLFKEIKKELGITDSDIALMFGYKSANVFRNSTRRKNVMEGIVKLYNLIKSNEEINNTKRA